MRSVTALVLAAVAVVTGCSDEIGVSAACKEARSLRWAALLDEKDLLSEFPRAPVVNQNLLNLVNEWLAIHERVAIVVEQNPECFTLEQRADAQSGLREAQRSRDDVVDRLAD